MAQKTDVELPLNVPGEESSAAEARASGPPAGEKANFLRERPHARKFLVAAVLIVLVGGFFAWRYLSSYETTDDAQIDGHLMPVSARVSGYVTQVNVHDNQVVEAGAVLVEIDPRSYQVAVDQARAALADAEASARAQHINVPVTSVSTSSQVSVTEAEVQNAEAGIPWAQQQHDAAQAQLTQAEANNTRAQNDLARYKQLIEKQEISQQTYDQAVAAASANAAAVAAARAAVAAAAQQVTQARARLALAQANWRNAQTGPQQVESTRARALAAEAAVQQKRAVLEQVELDLQYTRIVAPARGIVSKNVEIGMNVQPGQQLLSIVPLDDVWVTANFKETQLKHMRPGQRVEIKVDANGRTYAGHIESIAGASGSRVSLLPPENATGNYVKVVQRVPVKILLDPGQNNDLALRLGMSVEPKVFLN